MYTPTQTKVMKVYQVADLQMGADKIVSETMAMEDSTIQEEARLSTMPEPEVCECGMFLAMCPMHQYLK